jgi:hypothetical protein
MNRHSFVVSAFALATAINLTTAPPANAAVTAFTDKGLDFVINDDDPLAPTIDFSDKLFNVPVATGDSITEIHRAIIPQPFPNPPLVIDEEFTITISPSSVSPTVTKVTALAGTTSILPDNSTLSREPFRKVGTPFALSGDWSVTGPTETVTGLFTLDFNPTTGYQPTSIDASQFPSAVMLDSALTLGDVDYLAIGTEVDGASINFTMRGVFRADSALGATFETGFKLPIPPAVWLFGSGLLGIIGIARRKKAA